MVTEYPTPAQVSAIADIPDPVRRNYRITVGYWQIARAMHERLPGGATWCAFGTWASRQAGASIRKEDLERTIARRLQAKAERWPLLPQVRQALPVPEARLLQVIGDLSRGLPGVDRTSKAVAAGNALIFREIGRAFSRYLSGDVATFAGELRAGPAPEGQELLRSAFGHYAAAELAEPELRAQLVFLGNLQIALHEQTAAQPLIREAMDAALLDVADTRRRIVSRLAEGPLGTPQAGLAARLFNLLADMVSEALREIVRLVVTERLMSIELPDSRTLRLGHDVHAAFSPSLTTITFTPLAEQVAALDRTPSSTAGSGSVDWSNLGDRMHFLTDFFRCFQDDASMFSAPFSDVEMAAIRTGTLPVNA